MNSTEQPAVAGPVEPTVRPCAWMAQHGRQPVQATVSKQQADAWAQAGGDVVELYDGVTFWNAIASADKRRRELQAQIEQLQDRLARAGLEQQRAVRDENARLRAAMGVAYGYLWCVNNEPGTPHQYAPERAAYQARKALHDLLTKAERGHFINVVLPLVRGSSDCGEAGHAEGKCGNASCVRGA